MTFFLSSITYVMHIFLQTNILESTQNKLYFSFQKT